MWSLDFLCTEDEFSLLQGTLAVCNARSMVYWSQAHYGRRCNSWAANTYCKAKQDWSAEPAGRRSLMGSRSFSATSQRAQKTLPNRRVR